MKHGAEVAAFERELASYLGAKYCVALCNGTATLHTALVALGIDGGSEVATTPLSMSATTLAILHAGALPVFVDIDPDTWTMGDDTNAYDAWLPVSLYGLHTDIGGSAVIDDAAQTFRFNKSAAFTSLSFQASKLLSTGEGGALLTNSEELATKAREFSSLGYRMSATQARIDSATLKAPDFTRHYQVGFNYRMNDCTAALGLKQLANIDVLKQIRLECAAMYREAIQGCEWVKPQFVPAGSHHDYWCYAMACDTPERALALQADVVKHGGEMPYGAWRLSYQEPAFKHPVFDQTIFGTPLVGHCPNAESLQPRLLQMQTNCLESAQRNARALRKALS